MKMKKTLLNLLFAIAATLSSHSLYAQNGIDTNKTEASINKELEQLKKEVNANTTAIAEIQVKERDAGNLISEAARLQNQGRAVLFFGSAIGGVVFASTGNITAFLAITGISSLVATIDALLSTKRLSEAGNTLSGIIPNEPTKNQIVPTGSITPNFQAPVSSNFTIKAPYGTLLIEEINKKRKNQLICPDSINCERYSIFQTLNFHDCKFQMDRMENFEDASYKMFTIQDLEKIDKEIDTNTKFQFLKEMGWIWSSSYGPNYGEIYCYNFSKHERASFLMTDLAQFFCVRVN
jgi:hypothetical protein